VADVVRHELEDVDARLAGSKQLQRRDENAFLVQRGAVGRKAAPAHVDVVPQISGEAHHALVKEDGYDHGSVVDVPADLPRIVGDQDVTRLELVGGELFQEALDRLPDVTLSLVGVVMKLPARS